MAKADSTYNKKGQLRKGPVPDYTPRNTSERGNGIYVRNKLVCEPKGRHHRAGSYFTPKGGMSQEELAFIREANKKGGADAPAVRLEPASPPAGFEELNEEFA